MWPIFPFSFPNPVSLATHSRYFPIFRYIFLL
jgi:hypothetical protein